MAIITKSDKLVTTGELDQTKMVSEQYVLVRIIHETNSYTLMTATAKEDDGSYLAYPEKQIGCRGRECAGSRRALRRQLGSSVFPLQRN